MGMLRLGLVLFVFFIFHHSTDAEPRNASTIWRTLNGSPPLVVARGGYSGIFPDSGYIAYWFANLTGLRGVISWCDVQLTKDSIGICMPSVNLGNSSNINRFYNSSSAIINIDGRNQSGYFSFDYTHKQLENVTLTQGIFSRTNTFDGQDGIIDVYTLGQLNMQSIWLNIQHDKLYREKNLSMTRFLNDTSGNVTIGYVSSPEVAFLKGISAIFRGSKTKLIFSFLEADMIEPSTNQTYAALLKNLTFFTTFASGILVPKSYILPVDANLYLLPTTTIVSDAHRIGLEVYAAGFANDISFPYDFNYNPISEYLSYIDNANSSVDGVISDFPVSASLATVCFPHLRSKIAGTETPIIISHGGASGVYPACTDLAYKQAVQDRADFIDCPIQITKDGTLICMSSADLMTTTTVTASSFATTSGIFTFNLTWEQIQTLKPTISNPYFTDYKLLRNPRHQNDGNFMTLSDFLAFAQVHSSGVVIIIENTALIARRLGFDVVDSVNKALSNSTIPLPKVKIMSTNSSVLIEFKQKTSYDLVYKIDESISDAETSSIQDIKEFATAVAVKRDAIFSATDYFVSNQTKVVSEFQSANLSVYAYAFKNEFLSIPWDFLSDPIVEIHNYVRGAQVNGIITDHPQTASSYRRNKCLDRNNYNIPLVPPHFLLGMMAPRDQPTASPPYPPLMPGDVVESPLPPATANFSGNPISDGGNPISDGGIPITPDNSTNSQANTLPSFLTSSVIIYIASLLLIH